jgi:hypothetical protein
VLFTMRPPCGSGRPQSFLVMFCNVQLSDIGVPPARPGFELNNQVSEKVAQQTWDNGQARGR